jgi:outer membrane immunogenic protein
MANAKLISSAVAVLLATSAAALAGSAPAAPPAFTWTGFSAGLDLGYAGGNVSAPVSGGGYGAPVLGELKTGASGIVGGAKLGYDYELGNFVVGAATDFSGANVVGSTALSAATPSGSANGSLSSTIDYYGTVHGKVGYAFDRFLPYFTGGFAYGGVSSRASLDVGGAATSSALRPGWTVGLGMEYAITNDLSVSTEWQYIDLSQATDYSGQGAPGLSGVVQTRDSANVVKGGLNYKFGASPY